MAYMYQEGESMQPITVAMVEIDQDQHIPVERFIRQNETNVELLTDTQSNYDKKVERRFASRNSVTPIDNAVARVKRLNPRVLLINANKSIDEYCDLLLALRHQCPSTQAILIINETMVEENYLLKVLASGARGFISNNQDSLNFAKIVKAIDQGEAWVSRKMTGKIMHEIVSTSRCDSPEGDFDSSR